MNKMLNAGLAALVAAGSVAAVATPAAAHDGYEYGYGDYGHHDNTGAIIASGIAGLALGAILSSGHHSTSYGSGYYGSEYGNGYSSYGNGYNGYGDYYSGYGNGYSGYGNGYNSYGNGYGYGNSGYGYRQCVQRRTVWSPYYGQYVVQNVRYSC